MKRHWVPILLATLVSPVLLADEIRVAVAANFVEAARVISKQFSQHYRHKVTLLSGSTGKHYAQIMHGAPIDVFLAADSRRPQLLETNGKALAGSCFTYAIGRLVLWSPQADFVDGEGLVLAGKNFRHLAIANPRLAPYGQAAQSVLEKRQLWDSHGKRIVQGESVGQTFQFVRSGNAQLGFVAWSQLKKPGRAIDGSYWLVPRQLHSPITQQAVQISRQPAAGEFLRYLQSDEAKAIMSDFGYDTADAITTDTQ